MLLIWLFWWVHLVLGDLELPSGLALTEHSFQLPDFVLSVANSDLSLFSGHRDYYTILMLTSSDPKHGCELCVISDRLLRGLSQAWFSDWAGSNYLFFVEVDIVDRTNADIFKFLEVRTIPEIRIIPPSGLDYSLPEEAADDDGTPDPFALLRQPHIEWKVPVGLYDEQLFAFADFISKTILKNILLRSPYQSAKFGLTFVVTLLTILAFKKKGPKKITGNFSKKKIYIVLSILAVLAFTGGYEFTVMQQVPFVARNEHNDVIIISGGVHYQLGIETVIVGANYFLLAASSVLLVFLGQYKVTETTKISSEEAKQVLVLLTTVVLYLLYSCLTSIFVRKDHEYPYYFTKLF